MGVSLRRRGLAEPRRCSFYLDLPGDRAAGVALGLLSQGCLPSQGPGPTPASPGGCKDSGMWLALSDIRASRQRAGASPGIGISAGFRLTCSLQSQTQLRAHGKLLMFENLILVMKGIKTTTSATCCPCLVTEGHSDPPQKLTPLSQRAWPLAGARGVPCTPRVAPQARTAGTGDGNPGAPPFSKRHRDSMPALLTDCQSLVSVKSPGGSSQACLPSIHPQMSAEHLLCARLYLL